MSWMRQVIVFVLTASILAVAQVLLKRGMVGFGGPVLSISGVARLLRYILSTPLVLGGYALGFVGGLFWLAALSVVDLNVAAPLTMGMYFVELLVLSHVILKESLSSAKWLGALLILVGILILGATGLGRRVGQRVHPENPDTEQRLL